jgi:hypothetical protein
MGWRPPALFRTDLQFLRALGLFLALRAGFALIWWLAPFAAMPPLLVTALVLADLMALGLPFLVWPVLWRVEVNPGLLWSLRAGLLVVLAHGVAGGLDRLADAHASPPPREAPPPTLETIGDVIVFSGPINLAAFRALEETLRGTSGLRVLRLTSEGGNIPAARGMARLVAEAGLATEAAGLCASACTRVFIAGQTRTLRIGARLGFHRWRLETNVRILDTATEEARDRAAFAARGVDPAFLDRAFTTPHGSMWFPTTTELRAAGVLTD